MLTELLAETNWTQVGGGAVAMLGVLAATFGVLRTVVLFRNGRASKGCPPPSQVQPQPPSFPCPQHTEHLRGLDHEVVEIRATDRRQWDEITDQGKSQARLEAKMDAIGADVTRLVDRLLPVLVCLALPFFSGCALFEGRRQAADCTTRHARRIRVKAAEISPAVAALPENARPAVRSALKDLTASAVSIEKWGGAMTEDFKPPESRLELATSAEDLGRVKYVAAARAKNALLESIPLPGAGPASGGWLGTLLGGATLGGGGILAGLMKLLSKGRRLTRERDREREEADDLHDAIDEMKHQAANGGLRQKGFAEVLEKHPPARRRHARRKLEACS